MIEAKDLRIGNLITDEFYENFKTIITVHSINKEGINLEIEDDGNWAECAQRWIGVEYKFDKLFGIPLTPEILEKCGFVLNGDYYKRQPEFENIEYRLIEFPSGTWIVSKGFINYNHEITAIKYLHQLQNLYFALTNTELIINL